MCQGQKFDCVPLCGDDHQSIVSDEFRDSHVWIAMAWPGIDGPGGSMKYSSPYKKKNHMLHGAGICTYETGPFWGCLCS